MNGASLQVVAFVLGSLAVWLPSWGLAQPCLEESAVDQRALTALRDVVEEACPCASFGADGRADYEVCAAAELRAALEDGRLRQACGFRAQMILGASTCGTADVACARLGREAGAVPSCRITPARDCRNRVAARRVLARTAGGEMASRTQIRSGPGANRNAFRETVCPEQTHCADVQDWTAGTCFDVRGAGPYDAGVRLLSLSKPSEVDGSPRSLETVVWYPASPGSGDPDSTYDAVVDAPFDASAGPRPIVLFSHGSCGFERQSLFLTAWLATHGFVVVAPPHPGNTLFEFPGCGNPENLGPSAIERPADMVFVLDTMLAENEDAGSPFFHRLDPDAIAMSGHSFGGLTTFLTAARDDRIRVAMPLAAASPPDGRFGIPSLTIIGDVDSVVNNQRSIDAHRRSAHPKWLVSILHTGHYAFSDNCFPGPDCEPPLVLEQTEAHVRVRRWVLPFLKAFLEGEEAFAPFLTTEAGPSFQVEVR